MSNDGTVRPEDYQEPHCPLIDPATGQPCKTDSVPMQRVVEKLDEYCDRKDFTGARRHLDYWLAEAQYIHDKRGEFSMRNEMMGFYRKQGEQEAAIDNAQAALALMEEIQNDRSISGGTCYVNVGTVYDQFGMAEEALGYFKKAEEVFTALPHKDHGKIGGLYNNMALALMDIGRYAEATDYYKKAYDEMAHVEHGELEQAITLLNMSDCLALEQGVEAAQDQIDEYVRMAKALLDTESLPRNGYYAFVCEKCAPGFYCYGAVEEGAEIEARAEEIYAGIK